MATASTWILSLKVFLISTGILGIVLGLKISVPLVLEFSVSQAPLWWSGFRSWLKPPYLYVVINGIIITIAASSRFNQNNGEKDQMEQMQPRPKISEDQQPMVEYETKSGWDSDAVESSDFVYEENQRGEEVETRVSEEESNVAVEDDRDGNEFVISKSEWIPPSRTDSSEIPLDALLIQEKPAPSSRFGHRKPVKANPEGGRALTVAKPKRHETLENTWKMITEGKSMPLSRHLKKSDTWENHGRDINMEALTSSPLMKKSETFRDRTNYQLPPEQVSSFPASGKLRKEPSLSQDELNRRVEAFIKKFNDEMRLQRQESLNQYMEMVNRGS
uniref:CFE protein n=1 Tax=Gossypium herbaceum TaxID=34274 RepID=A0A059Q7Q5_GOSHE|nr:CFE protein [Gossypium herbaceum]